RALHLDRAVVRLDDRLDDREAETCPVSVATPRRGRAGKRVEDASLLLLGNAVPRIGDLDDSRPALGAADDPDRVVVPGRPQRVLDQLVQREHEALPVSDHGSPTLELNCHLRGAVTIQRLASSDSIGSRSISSLAMNWVPSALASKSSRSEIVER